MNAKVSNFPSRSSAQVKQHSSGQSVSGGDGGSGDVLEPRVAKLESHVEHIQRDTTDIKQKLERVADDVSDLKVSMAAFAGRQDTFDIKLDTMDKNFEVKLDALDKKFDLRLDALDKKFDAKFDGLDKKFATKADLHESQAKQQQWMFRTMLGLISTGVVLTGAIVAAIFRYMPH
ncbi:MULTISPECIES: hypothetical protein [Aeromonas]|uniref:hypothetical protein n=1 Tax=Aeromonas TaxID=642 RepID=UPI001119AA82|nr:hypothetical protein [Aeromonas dhakensis]TNI55451.1 hypothetical protein CF126_11655 [Aeromonas dhakensis]